MVTEDMLKTYFLAASSIFEPDRAAERINWAQTAMLAEAIIISYHRSTTSKVKLSFIEDFSINRKNLWSELSQREEPVDCILGLLGFLTATPNIYGSLRRAWVEWLWNLNEEEDQKRGLLVQGATALLLIRTIELCAGRAEPKGEVARMEYACLTRLAISICNRLQYCSWVREGNMILKCSDRGIESEMQELVQCVIEQRQSPDGLNRETKQTFMDVVKSFYYLSCAAAGDCGLAGRPGFVDVAPPNPGRPVAGEPAVVGGGQQLNFFPVAATGGCGVAGHPLPRRQTTGGRWPVAPQPPANKQKDSAATGSQATGHPGVGCPGCLAVCADWCCCLSSSAAVCFVRLGCELGYLRSGAVRKWADLGGTRQRRQGPDISFCGLEFPVNATWSPSLCLIKQSARLRPTSCLIINRAVCRPPLEWSSSRGGRSLLLPLLAALSSSLLSRHQPAKLTVKVTVCSTVPDQPSQLLPANLSSIPAILFFA
ncbi:Ent-copalyl diphosphate synthase 2 [Platanthera zijinensis]|uniref:Ent-copalyl diphosphate synthase 2 n=1 Tax=Platanthera zijinensis TaxID=2320716 RepID=A0AAP0GAZ6_9ASPA